ncbi:hypothetical protein REPUB_Repub04eG0086500 [Reevesia pubescens]
MRSKGCKANMQRKLIKIICSPIRILSKARDLYIQSIKDCAGRVNYSGGVVFTSHPAASRLPKSYSVDSSKANDDEEFRRLLRAASKRGIDSKVEQKLQQQQQSRMKPTTTGSAGGIMGMRSYSVGIGKIGRIDEDKPCSFEEDEVDAMADLVYPRSRSHAFRRNLIVYR